MKKSGLNGLLEMGVIEKSAGSGNTEPGAAAGGTFALPPEAVTETFAFIGIRGAGKTTGAKRLAEEFCRLQLPWIAFDPVGVWWGLRAKQDGSPSDLPVVVFGGERADLPLPRHDGAKIARAIVAENICAVIDVSRESKTFWRTFLVDLCLELRNCPFNGARHVFIEEAPEFVPQRGRTDLTARTKEAVERLVRLGRNEGFGCSLISQRSATVDKDVLSQCENLFVLRSTGAHDRKALKEWLEGHDGGEPNMKAIAGFADGECYFWSPSWLKLYCHVKLMPSTTFHPGRTRTAFERGDAAKSVQLGDVQGFVRRLQAQLTREAKPSRLQGDMRPLKDRPSLQVLGDEKAKERIEELEQQLVDARTKGEEAEEERQRLLRVNADVRKSLEAAAAALKPLHDAYEIITGEISAGQLEDDPRADASVWAPWLEKAGGPGSMRRRMLEVMIERRQVTRTQLCTLAGASPRGGSTRNAISWLSVNKLIVRDGEQLTLAEVG